MAIVERQETFAYAVVAALAKHGIHQVFGIPGTHNLELFRALQLHRITVIPAHHEQGLGYAADALSRVTGKPAVVVTTTGPGITNLITSLATSAAASVPVLAIAPGLPEGEVGAGSGWLHELHDQHGLMSQVVHSARATTVETATQFINDWMIRCGVGRPLPAYLEIPIDLIGEPDFTDPTKSGEAGGKGADSLPDLSHHERDAAVKLLAHAERPAIIAGRGACAVSDELRQVAELLNAPVLTTANAKGVLDESHPLALGVSLRAQAGHELLRAADAVLVVGSDLGRSEFWGPTPLERSGLVRIDVDSRSIRANVVPEVELLGRAETILPLMQERLGSIGRTRSGESDSPAHWAAIHASEIVRELEVDGIEYRTFHAIMQEEVAGLSVAVTGDSSQVSYFGTATFWKSDQPNRFLYPAGYGTLGYAVPAAVGAALSGTCDRVLAITGEGGLLFSVQELATVSELALPVVTIVFVNGGYQEIREGMRELGIAETGVDFPAPDFISLASGFRIPGTRIVSDGKEETIFREAFRRAISTQGPAVIEVVLSN